MVGLLAKVADVDEMASYGSSGGHGRADQVRAPALPLAAFEVAVRRRRATLFGLETVGIPGQAHRTAGLAPFEAGLDEEFVQPFVLGLRIGRAYCRENGG